MPRPLLDQLLKLASGYGGCRVRDLQGRSRENHIVEGRIMFVALAKYFGYRNYVIAWSLHRWHTAVSYFIAKAEAKMADPFFKDYFDSAI